MPPNHKDSWRSESAQSADSTALTSGDTRLVIEFTIPAEGFVLASTLRTHPGTVVEFEKLIPASGQILPYLWAMNDGDDTALEETINADSTVLDCRRVAALQKGVLYRMDWADSEHGLLGWLRGRDATMLQSEGTDGRWNVKLRVGSREALSDFQSYCRDHEINFDLIRLYELTEPKMGQFNVSEKQREILITAMEMGYFEIPREVTLEGVADTLNISKRAASERLRRGYKNLVSNTLTIGQPAGVGVGTDAP